MIKESNYRKYKLSLEYYCDFYNSKFEYVKDLARLRRKAKVLYVKNIYNFDCSTKTNYWYIIQDHFFDINEFSKSKVRNQIKKSLSIYQYKIIDKTEILNKGYKVYKEASQRFNSKSKPKSNWSLMFFNKYVNDCFEKDYDFWGGYKIETGELAMWIAIEKKGDIALKEIEKLSYKHTKFNPTYGLNYEITKYYLLENKYKLISTGARSTDGHSNVQDFLIEKLQFRKAYCNLQLVYSPFIKLVILLFYPLRKQLSFLLPTQVNQLLTLHSYSVGL